MSKKNYKAGDTSGIYKITCIANQKSYIGQAYQVWDRLGKHNSMLKNHKHPNKHMQSAADKYGIETFEWSIYELCSREELNQKEEAAIALIGRTSLFNFTDGGEGQKGFTHELTAIEKDGIAKKAQWDSGLYDDPSMEIQRINVFSGTITNYTRAGLVKEDGFTENSVMSCLYKCKQTHKGFFWKRATDQATDQATYQELLSKLSKLGLQQAKSYRSFALKLDNLPIEDESTNPKPSNAWMRPTSKPIERIDLVTGEVKEYASIADAVQDGFERSSIDKALKGQIQTYRGNNWQLLPKETQIVVQA